MKAESDQEVEREDPRNPMKRAEREKEFRTVGQFKEILTNPADVYEAVTRYTKSFKSVKNVHPKNRELNIIDFSLAARGPQEDEVYTEQPYFRNNIRRGNTLIVNNKTKEAQWGRKGLMKFFDISEKSIYAIINSDTVGLNTKNSHLHYAIFSEIENVLSCNEELAPEHQAKCHLFRLNKANGENAQVSYFPATNEWVISSKNVSVLVAERADLKAYEGDRYQFSILIAEAWFNIIDNKKKQELEALKADLTGRTLVGEYCGNPDFQHLVKYEHITIFFYALVEVNSQNTCIPPVEAFRMMEKHHIPIVKNYEHSFYGKFTSFVELGESLKKLFDEVATSSIFEDEEGSVVYFVLEKPKEFCEYVSDRYLQASVPIPIDHQSKDVWWNVSSLGKVKTLEYRILRKLREKLKFFTRLKKGDENKEKAQNDQKKMQEKYGSFEKEVYYLVKKQELVKPLNYYFCAAIVAFDYVFKHRKNQRNLLLLSEHYLDFVSLVFWSIENKRELTPALMNDEELHKQLRGTTWENYSTDVINQYGEMLEKLAPKYAKIKKSLNAAEVEGEGEEVEVQDD